FRAGGFGGFWDKNQYINGGRGFGMAIPYAYPVPVHSPPGIGELSSNLINDGVDGLIADADEQPQFFSDTVANIRNLKSYIDNFDRDHYVATADDNPFYVPQEAYSIRAHTDSDLLDGTGNDITFKLTGDCNGGTS